MTSATSNTVAFTIGAVPTTPAWFTALAEKTWTVIAGGTGYAGSAFQKGQTLVGENPGTPGIQGTSGQSSIILAWCGGVANQDHKELILPANGGHGNYWGNEVYALKLAQDVPAWQRLVDPTPTAGFATNPPCNTYGLAPAVYADGRPASMHTAGTCCYGAGKVWILGQSAYSNIAGSNYSVFSFNRGGLPANPTSSVAWANNAGLWSFIGNAQPGMGTYGFTPAAFDTVTGLAWGCEGQGDAKYYYSVNSATGTITNYSQSIAASQINMGSAMLVVCTDLRILVATSKDSSNVAVLNLANPGAGFTVKAVSGLSSVSNGWGWVYHAPSKSLLGHDYEAHTSGQIVKVRIPITGSAYNPSGSWTATTITKAGGVNPSAQFTDNFGTYGRFNIINDMGNGQAMLVLTSGTASGYTYVYKLPTSEISNETLYALNFPSNGDSPSSAFVAMQFLNPQSNGLPIWGPGNAGTTWIWRYRPVQQTGYYVTFWWSRADGSFQGSDGYYGAHPYPNPPGQSTAHYWEIATGGGDVVNNRNGSPVTVVKDQWYTQALRVIRNGNGTKTLIFYFDLPNTTNAYVIETTQAAGYGETMPPSPAVTFGDSPWYPGFGHERMSGQLGQVKIFASALSEADMLTEASNMNSIATSAGQSAIWWGKNGFATVDDLTCDYGTGRTFAWAQATKATLGDVL